MQVRGFIASTTNPDHLTPCVIQYDEFRKHGISLADYVRKFERDLAFDDTTIYIIKGGIEP